MNLIKIGSGMIIIQNVMIILFDFVFIYSLESRGLIGRVQVFLAILAVFSLDLIGFMIFGIGLIRFSQHMPEESRRYRIAGIAVIGWLLSRLYFQIYIVNAVVTDQDFSTTIVNTTVLWYGINSLCLLTSGLTKVNRRYLYYTLLNFIAIWISIIGWILQIPGSLLEITVFIKLITIPVLAILVFRKIYQDNWGEIRTNKYTTHIYPVDQ